MKAEFIQNVLIFNTNGENSIGVLLKNSDLELLEVVFEISEDITTGKNKTTLRTLLKEIAAFKKNKAAMTEEVAEPLPTKAFFMLPREATEVQCPQDNEGRPEQVFMFTREEVEAITAALFEASRSLRGNEKQRFIKALYKDFRDFLSDLPE